MFFRKKKKNTFELTKEEIEKITVKLKEKVKNPCAFCGCGDYELIGNCRILLPELKVIHCILIGCFNCGNLSKFYKEIYE